MARTFALILGIAFLLGGISGFVWLQPIHPDAPHLSVSAGYGLALGVLPVNVLHNIVHLLFGALGLAAYGGMFSARYYAQIVAVAYGLLILLGLFPATYTTFGLIPIYGNDVWFHALLAIPAAYVGFMAPSDVAVRHA